MPHRPLIDPFKVKDDVARGPPEIEHHGDFVRLIFWNDAGSERRYVVRRIVMSTADYVAMVQALGRPQAF
jgi:hypothetical protein